MRNQSFDRMLLVVACVLIVVVSIASVLTVSVVVGAFAPSPISYQLPNKVDPDTVHPGDPITITLKQCATDGVNGQVYYTISSTLVERDGLAPRRQLPENSHTVPEGCHTTTASFTRVPADLEPGAWHIESAIVAYGAHGPKLLHSVTEWFTVIPLSDPLPS